MTQAELYKRAQALDIEGRSDMTKDELAAAIAEAEAKAEAEAETEAKAEAETEAEAKAEAEAEQKEQSPCLLLKQADGLIVAVGERMYKSRLGKDGFTDGGSVFEGPFAHLKKD